MSMEAMLDEERREVLALLEGQAGSNSRSKPPAPLGARTPSPYTSPRSPVRSMLDVAPVRSMLDVDGPPAPPVRSMLDVDSPPSSSASSAKQVLSSPSSPTESNFHAHKKNHTIHPRSLSDAAVKPVEFGPRSSSQRLDPTSEYQFSGIITHGAGQALPKRVGQGGKRASGSMAEVMRGADVSGLVLPGDRGRHYSIGGPSSRLTNKSKSPHNRLDVRSRSPHSNLLSGRHLSPVGKALIAENQTVDYQNAYRHLSDANIARLGGSLSELTRRKRSDDMASTGRLEKDYLSPDGDLLPDDSSDDSGSSSSEDEGERGRKVARSFEKRPTSGESAAGSSSSRSPETPRKTLSLLAAAEEERIQVASQQPAYKYRSLLDDAEPGPRSTSQERPKPSKTGVHPATSFDLPPRSGNHTPLTSDTEAELTDIKRAQRLAFSMTPVINTPEAHRAIRIIARGDYSRVVRDAEEEHRWLRKYLVATDLSEESTHALEWAVGTVLRDGDTLIAIYCVDEETGILAGGEGGGGNGGGTATPQQVPDDPKAMREQAAAINAVSLAGGGKTGLAASSSMPSLSLRSSPLVHVTDTSSSPAPSSKERSKAEEERFRAVQDITDRVTKLLRKTRLQVRVIVEVIHCKNPKHLITEVIDVVNPTLVILGSRGRSALKGVILGSFSNYLVTKSSVPVMVARKRLRKHSKYKRPINQQVNNLSNPAARSLANAKID
ncbi:hypothetical protein VTK73DRAFT_5507 [Phialemonium thermophilum]|uniref:UspA domain-containing protein n=1 Tax=Phialemonium thermophilum TaxID=223376 RepID=A0ABR3WN77_9PEZI